MQRRVAVYVRVSTQEQAASGYSIGEQTERLKKYCEAHDWTVVSVYTDPGFSGAKMGRPELQRLLRDAGRGIFDTVLVWKLDRLSRSQKDTMYMVESCFLAGGIDFISMNENFDTSTPFGRAMVGILSVFAQLERDQIKERMAMGKVGRAKEGKWRGGSNAPIGYAYENGELRVLDYEAMQVRLVFDWFLNGCDGRPMSLKAIEEKLAASYTTRYGSWTKSGSAGRALRNRVYVGEVSYGGEWYPGGHEPIVSREVFDAAQVKYDTYVQAYGKSQAAPFQAEHLLTGLLFCGECGARYCVNTTMYTRAGKKMKYSYYRCYTSTGQRRMAKAESCSARGLKMEELERAVVAEVSKLALDPELVRSMARDSLPDPGERERAVSGRISEIEKQTVRILDLYQTGMMELTACSSRLEALRREKDALLLELEEIKTPQPDIAPDEAVAALGTVADVFSSGTDSEKRELLRCLIRKIVIYEDRMEFHWAFCAP